MKVRELIEILSEFDPDADVHFGHNYGDYWKTQVAPEVQSVDRATVRWSEYHSLHSVVDDDYNNEEDIEVVLLT